MKLFWLRGIAKALLSAIVVFVLFNLSCTQYRQVEKEMIWTCTSPGDTPATAIHPFQVLTLELQYKEDAGHYELIQGPLAEKLCQERPKSNKKTLRVLHQVSGSDLYGARGYSIEAIEGQKYPLHSEHIVGGSMTGRPDPLSSTFRRYFQKTK